MRNRVYRSDIEGRQATYGRQTMALDRCIAQKGQQIFIINDKHYNYNEKNGNGLEIPRTSIARKASFLARRRRFEVPLLHRLHVLAKASLHSASDGGSTL